MFEIFKKQTFLILFHSYNYEALIYFDTKILSFKTKIFYFQKQVPQ